MTEGRSDLLKAAGNVDFIALLEQARSYLTHSWLTPRVENPKPEGRELYPGPATLLRVPQGPLIAHWLDALVRGASGHIAFHQNEMVLGPDAGLGGPIDVGTVAQFFGSHWMDVFAVSWALSELPLDSQEELRSTFSIIEARSHVADQIVAAQSLLATLGFAEAGEVVGGPGYFYGGFAGAIGIQAVLLFGRVRPEGPFAGLVEPLFHNLGLPAG